MRSNPSMPALTRATYRSKTRTLQAIQAFFGAVFSMEPAIRLGRAHFEIVVQQTFLSYQENF